MQRSLTNYHIKLIAAATMLIDHIGVVFFPQEYLFRAIGRISFPLFAWLLVQGEAHTRNVWAYALRLLILALLSQPIYMQTFRVEDLNILFLLLIGLGCLRLSRAFPQYQFIPWLCGGALAQAVHANYEVYGIVVVGLLWQYRSHSIWWACWVLLHLMLLAADPSYGAFQFPAMVTPFLFQFTNGELGAKARWFYLFYPLHLAALYGIRLATATG
ncbi:TraX family protein [Oscillatoria sp. FACHB-1407]|uniref:TraX family protein n=1 Tax=Oscillatoria sp. FACHB-1407 TaxID=2692847 RepID=UPI001689699B|nr:TraX family protein [Oscillatoria sp. FACHB-1407]MBD2462864.1 TraX family protein [Oscillatoria sp. FACHB-1407]